jgi:hypothetical protein
MKFIDVAGFDPDDPTKRLFNLYQVPGQSAFVDSDIVTVNGNFVISSIAFYGHNPLITTIPESGSTLCLMLLGFGAVAFRRQNRHT